MSSTDSGTTGDTINLLKHRINTLEGELCELQLGTSKLATAKQWVHSQLWVHSTSIQALNITIFHRHNKYRSAGHAIRRLVTLHDRVQDLVNEADHRACIELTDTDDHFTTDSEELGIYLECWCAIDTVQGGSLVPLLPRTFEWIPSLKADIAADSEDYQVKLIMKEVSANMSMLLVTWPATSWTKVQMEPKAMMHPLWRRLLLSGSCVLSPPQSQHLNPIQRLGVVSIMMQQLGWSVQWITTGQICSIHCWLQFVLHDWHHIYRHRANICNFHPNYLATADCWPYFLYKNERYDPEDPVKGLFKNAMLVQVRCGYSFSGRPSNTPIGIQTCLYFPKFSGFRKCG